MLYLIVEAGGRRYALETTSIVRALPVVRWQPMPGTAPGVAGVFNCQGDRLPLLDLRLMIEGEPSVLTMASRILLLKPEATGQGLAGLLAERAIDTISLPAQQVPGAAEAASALPFIGRIVTGPDETYRLLDIDTLLAGVTRSLDEPVAEAA